MSPNTKQSTALYVSPFRKDIVNDVLQLSCRIVYYPRYCQFLRDFFLPTAAATSASTASSQNLQTPLAPAASSSYASTVAHWYLPPENRFKSFLYTTIQNDLNLSDHKGEGYGAGWNIFTTFQYYSKGDGYISTSSASVCMTVTNQRSNHPTNPVQK